MFDRLPPHPLLHLLHTHPLLHLLPPPPPRVRLPLPVISDRTSYGRRARLLPQIRELRVLFDGVITRTLWVW